MWQGSHWYIWSHPNDVYKCQTAKERTDPWFTGAEDRRARKIVNIGYEISIIPDYKSNL